MRPASHDTPACALHAELRHRPRRAWFGALAAAGLALGVSAVHLDAQPRPDHRRDAAAAQGEHVVVGRVRAGDESELYGVHVSLSVASPTAPAVLDRLTDESGTFRFEEVPAGPARVVVRRLGFHPESLTVDVPQVTGGALVVMLERVAAPLEPIVVQAGPGRAQPLPSAFDRRRAAGQGHFITRADIERRNPRRTSDLFRAIPGVSLSAGPSGSLAPRFRTTGRVTQCDPLYWLDGSPLSVTGFDLDAVDPRSIEAIEFYSGNATVPAALRGTMAAGGCGVIAIWTSRGGGRPEMVEAATADSLGALVERGWAYTADQVEMVAAPLIPPRPAYPDSLRTSQLIGRVVAEFVVDGQGKVAPETIGIVSSTHPLFTRAVLDALVDARFTPAYRQSKVVRQVVHLPVVFRPPTEPGRAPGAGRMSARSPHEFP